MPFDMYSNIANLNRSPSDYELALQRQQDNFILDDDLALFTDAEFFDWEPRAGSAQQQQQQQPPAGFKQDAKHSAASFNQAHNDLAQQPAEFMTGNFSIAPYNTGVSPELAVAQPAAVPLYPRSQNIAAKSPVASPTVDSPQEHRLSLSIDSPKPAGGAEDPARVAAEEDKRRRNTAASARFRVKKKQREQALEKSAKDMADRVSSLESKVVRLEMENKLLKDLLTEKNGKEFDMEELNRKASGESGPEREAHRAEGVGEV